MTDPKLRRAVWLLSKVLLDLKADVLGPLGEQDVLEAKGLIEVESHYFEGISGSAQGCTHRYMNSTVCGKQVYDHPCGLEPNGKTK
jgi:hypothetical protein